MSHSVEANGLCKSPLYSPDRQKLCKDTYKKPAGSNVKVYPEDKDSFSRRPHGRPNPNVAINSAGTRLGSNLVWMAAILAVLGYNNINIRYNNISLNIYNIYFK